MSVLSVFEVKYQPVPAATRKRPKFRDLNIVFTINSVFKVDLLCILINLSQCEHSFT